MPQDAKIAQTQTEFDQAWHINHLVIGTARLPGVSNPMNSKTLAHEWFDDLWNKRKIEAIDRFLAPDVIAHGLVDEKGDEIRGPSGFKKFFMRSGDRSRRCLVA